MKRRILLLLPVIIYVNIARLQAQQQPHAYDPAIGQQQLTDWLISPVKQKAAVYYSPDEKSIILYNGLVKRVFTVDPGFACISYKNMANEQQLLRAVKPEAMITIDNEVYNVGGLYGQKENGYLMKKWIPGLTNSKAGFIYKKFTIQDIKPYIDWKPAFWTSSEKLPAGKSITFHFEPRASALKGLTVDIHYELYDGIPLIVKSLTIHNMNHASVKINTVVNEVLAIVEEVSSGGGSVETMRKQHGIYVESNYAFNGFMRYDQSDQTKHWLKDTTYTSQVNYRLQTPALLEIYPDHGPGVMLKQGESYNSVRTYELLIDTYDRERRGLMIRRMYRTVAPWTNENPIFMHLISRNDQEVLNAINQCAATGYEALILSFGSHCNMEDTSAKNIFKWKKIADIAHSKGIKIGAYSLFSSRNISPQADVINPVTGKPGGGKFGYAPCFGSKWGLAYKEKIKVFLQETGFDIWENDGPYPGDICASATHPGHLGIDDSQWEQWKIQTELYRWCNEHGIYVNAPDWYFLSGTNKTGLGYREVNFSLPRDQQKFLNRQNIFDATWEETPSMCWGFVPLTVYQGGGDKAILEPLSEHLKDYQQLMMQYYGAGVQACYRGPRLYDTDETKDTVIKVINWYKKYRDILNSDIIHLRRADGRDWDGWMHVNPQLKVKGMIMIFNPLNQRITRNIKVPLYYTGIATSASVSVGEKAPERIKLNRKYEITIPVTLEPEQYQWITIK